MSCLDPAHSARSKSPQHSRRFGRGVSRLCAHAPECKRHGATAFNSSSPSLSCIVTAPSHGRRRCETNGTGARGQPCAALAWQRGRGRRIGGGDVRALPPAHLWVGPRLTGPHPRSHRRYGAVANAARARRGRVRVRVRVRMGVVLMIDLRRMQC
jgi:hypothetical protein